MRILPEAGAVTAAADPEQFTAGVWRTDVLGPDVAEVLRGTRFTYAPGARSGWHVHTQEQALIVLTGRGLIVWDGLDAPRDLRSGDWVHVSPGVPHWHGARDDSDFVHLAVTAGGTTVWLGPVTDPLVAPRRT